MLSEPVNETKQRLKVNTRSSLWCPDTFLATRQRRRQLDLSSVHRYPPPPPHLLTFSRTVIIVSRFMSLVHSSTESHSLTRQMVPSSWPTLCRSGRRRRSRCGNLFICKWTFDGAAAVNNETDERISFYHKRSSSREGTHNPREDVKSVTLALSFGLSPSSSCCAVTRAEQERELKLFDTWGRTGNWFKGSRELFPDYIIQRFGGGPPCPIKCASRYPASLISGERHGKRWGEDGEPSDTENMNSNWMEILAVDV